MRSLLMLRIDAEAISRRLSPGLDEACLSVSRGFAVLLGGPSAVLQWIQITPCGPA